MNYKITNITITGFEDKMAEREILLSPIEYAILYKVVDNALEEIYARRERYHIDGFQLVLESDLTPIDREIINEYLKDDTDEE